MLVLLLMPVAGAQEVGDPGLTSHLLTGYATPQLAPGESGTLAFNVSNPYASSMENVTLGVEIYEYRTNVFPGGLTTTSARQLEEPPVFAASGDPALRLTLGDLDPGAVEEVSHRIETREGTPGGSVFTQGTYVVRFRLAFDHDGQSALFLSPGFFSPTVLTEALREEVPEAEREAYRYQGFLNLSLLSEAAGEEVDGLLADAAFGVKVPLPRWPFYGLLAGALASFGLSLHYLRRERQETSKPINRHQE